MAQINISIYITADSIRIAKIRKSGNTINVVNAFSLATPPACFEDGQITNVKRLSHVISGAIGADRKSAKLYFTVYSRRIASKEIDVPFMKKPEMIGDMINANIDDYFPMGNMNEYITRHTILSTDQGEDGRKTFHICVYAVLKELVDSYFELARDLKMPVAAIDYQVNSLYHLTQWQNRHGTSLILQIDGDVTHITVFRGTSQLFRRSVPYGVDTLAQALANSKNISEEEARSILLNDKDAASASRANSFQSVAALRHQAGAVLIDDYLTPDELQELFHDYMAAISRVIDFFTNRSPDVALEKIKIIGVGVRISHIDRALKTILDLDIELIKRLNGINLRREGKRSLVTLDELTNYLPTIGAVIHPLDLRLAEDPSFRKGGIGYGFFIFLIVLAIGGVSGVIAYLSWQKSELESEKMALTQSIESLRYVEQVHSDYNTAGDYYALVEGFVKSTHSENEALYELITTLEQIMPVGTAFDSLNASDGKITISAVSANGKLGVARLIIELKKIPWIDEIWVSSVTDEYDDFGRVLEANFSLTFTISDTRLNGNDTPPETDEEGGTL